MGKSLDLTKISDNLTPKERVLLLVHNAVKEETTGKGILTEAEKHTLSEGWQPLNNEQIKEYNRFNQGWRLAGFAELDAQTAFLDMQIIFYKERQVSWHLLSYPIFREAKKWIERLKDIKTVTIDQAQEIVKKQKEVKLKEGEDFDYAVYLLTFETLDKPIQEDLIRLYPEAEYDHTYLDEEETLYDLHLGKKELTAEDKVKLTDLIIKRIYNSFAKEWQFHHYYASIPMTKVAKKWVEKRDIKLTPPIEEAFNEAIKKVAKKRRVDKEEAVKEFLYENLGSTIKQYAEDHKTTVEAELREVIKEWLDNGLLDEYEPVFKSKGHETYGENTKLPHNELFKLWLEAKTKAKKILETHIAKGELKREGDTITGESLYTFKGDYKFINEFKERVNKYDANLGIVYADDDPDHKGQHLDRELLITDLDKQGKPYFINFSQMAIEHLKAYFNTVGFVKETEVDGETVIAFSEEAKTYGELMQKTTEGLKKYYAILLTFKELFKRLSKTYDIDLTYKINKWLTEAEGFIESHNQVLREATKKKAEEILNKKTVKLKDDWFIDKDSIKTDQERVVGYFKELEETLGENF
jgi:hypothetical protein